VHPRRLGPTEELSTRGERCEIATSIRWAFCVVAFARSVRVGRWRDRFRVLEALPGGPCLRKPWEPVSGSFWLEQSPLAHPRHDCLQDDVPGEGGYDRGWGTANTRAPHAAREQHQSPIMSPRTRCRRIRPHGRRTGYPSTGVVSSEHLRRNPGRSQRILAFSLPTPSMVASPPWLMSPPQSAATAVRAVARVWLPTMGRCCANGCAIGYSCATGVARPTVAGEAIVFREASIASGNDSSGESR
jgi:hypothetical protein